MHTTQVLLITLLYVTSLHCSLHHLDLHSFPTRRSSDLSTRMQIGEIWYNSPGSDKGGNSSLNHEWVQLHNTSGSAITMTGWTDRKSTRLNSSHQIISYAVVC